MSKLTIHNSDFKDGMVNVRALFGGINVELFNIVRVCNNFIEIEGEDCDLKYVYINERKM